MIDVVEGVGRSRASPGRTVRVYRPPGFDGSGRTAYPVLVMLDGQNLFARSRGGVMGTWRVDETLDRAITSGAMPPWIVVGLDHRHERRIADLSPWPDGRLAMSPRGEDEAAFVTRDLLAWVDGHLPAADTARALVGSSLGGLLALFVAWRHPTAFSRVGALSPSVMWSNDELRRRWSARAPSPSRLYLDAGVHERFDAGSFQLDYGGAARDFAAHLRALGYGDDRLRVVLEPGGTHDEAAWGRRFEPAARWLLAADVT